MPEFFDSIAVVIPVYNGADTIGRAIDSVLAQTRVPEEIIVIDDGSTDSTPAVVAGYGSRIKYYRRENAGASAARNFGVRTAKSTWIAFLDHDDEWLSDKVSVLTSALAANPKACLCYSGYWIHSPYHQRRLAYVPQERVWPAIRLRNQFPPSVTLLRKDAILRAGGFNERLRGASCEDWDFFVRITASAPFISVPDPLVNYYESETSCSRNHRLMLPNTLSIVESTLLSGLTGVEKLIWRRRIRATLFYRAAISAREGGVSGMSLLIRSVLEWPSPMFERARFKTLAVECLGTFSS